MNFLGPFHFNTLMHPWFLVLLIAVLLILVAESVGGAPGTISVSTGEVLARISKHRRAFLRRLPAVLRAGGLTMLVIALARPMTGLQARPDRANVVDIMLCVDVSGSMRAIDFVVGGQRKDRLSVTKDAVRDFINSRKQNPGDRFGLDRLGLILYAGYAWTQCPLTLDYGVLERELELAHIDEEDPRKNGTAIGSAIGLAVSRLRKSEAVSKVVILLTDGLNNVHELEPSDAANLAKEYGIRIYTIGAGSRSEVLLPRQTPFGEIFQPERIPIDEEMLKNIAAATGGKYFRAEQTEALHEAYAEISQLEATELDVGDYYDYREGFLPYAIAGTVILLGSLFTRRVWFDPIP